MQHFPQALGRREDNIYDGLDISAWYSLDIGGGIPFFAFYTFNESL
jgi:hypothetical protein